MSGRVKDGISLSDAEQEVDSVIDDVVRKGISENELDKVKNQAEATLEFGEVEVINRAMNAAFACLSGDHELVNRENARIRAVSTDDTRRLAAATFRPENASVMYYKARKK